MNSNLTRNFNMAKTLQNGVFVICVLLSSAFPNAYAQTIVDSRMSGSWFDPTHSGEGFLLEVIEDNKAVIYWFTYDEEGAQRWFFGVGEVGNDSAVFDELLVASGPIFGETFNPDAVEYTDVGELTIQWSDCSNATATYTVNGLAGDQSLDRLSTLAGLDCEAPYSAPSAMTGSWFDQSHNGEGLVVEIFNDGRALVFWFSYDGSGQQAWFYGLGSQDGRTITIQDMYITSGGRFGPGFDPDQVQMDPWGNLVVELDCDYGKFDYVSELPEYGDGKQTLNRITNPGSPECKATQPPNILLVIADDLGLDASNQYDISAESPLTPELDQLAAQGLVFENAWSNPTCSPTRAGILTGKYGTRTGVLTPGDVLSEDETSLQSLIHQLLPGKYSDAVIGKWHLDGQRGGQDHPSDLGISHFAGILGGGVSDYEDWTLTINGQTSNETAYTTSKLVDLAIDWTAEQEKPWFMWLAFNAPHTPFHLPPAELHDRDLSGTEADIANNPLPYYFAAIESMDTELGRLLNSMDIETRQNTIVIFVGDNGTPGQVAQSPYSRTRAKGSLYQGGVNVPMFVSGPGITRVNQRETALVNTTDLFSTIAELSGVNVDQVHDSISFTSLFDEQQQSERIIQYSERLTDSGEEWTISDGMYKLIETASGARELYYLTDDPFENEDLIEAGNIPAFVVEDLQYLAEQIRQAESTSTLEQFTDNVLLSVEGDTLTISTDDLPNHTSPYWGVGNDLYETPHDGMVVNPNRISTQDITFRIPTEPEIASSPSDTGLGPIGVAVNGVVFFNQYAGVNRSTGEFLPLENEIASFDSKNGHPQNTGQYHYHFEPVYLTVADNAAYLGFAMDGFPIYGPQNEDGSALSLDECNGETHATSEYPEGIYHYHVTTVEPYIVGCFKGTPGTVSQ